MKITQRMEEISALLKLLAPLKPKIILEIGVDWGGTFLQWCQLAGSDGMVIGIDKDPRTPGKVHQNCGKEGIKNGQIILGDTRNPSILESIKKILGNRLLDFLFIDGDHSYEGVKKDYEIYSRLVRAGGMIAFHDIANPPNTRNPYRRGTTVGVGQFWRELQDGSKVEVIHRKGKPTYGIGVITKHAS